MILEQHYLACLAQASYLIADERTKKAVIVDPRRDVGLYLEAAEMHGVTIEHVLLTHFHADFLAGHLELRKSTGATIHLGAAATAEFPFEPMADGGRLELGDVRLEFLATPGHTPESTSILVFDLRKDAAKPEAVLTGDTLFIGDVGRPDLMASIGMTKEELGGLLYESLRHKLLPLPDETIVYPGHGAGSMCGKNLSSETSSTLGAQRSTNYALQPMSKDEFVRLVTAAQPDPPAYFPYDAQLNRSERATLDTVLAEGLRPLALEEVLRLANGGAQVLDARDADSFSKGHLQGATNIGLGGQYATWAGTLLDAQLPIVLITDTGKEEEALTRLGRIGFDRVEGYLEGGMAALAARPELTTAFARLSPTDLRERLSAPTAPLVVDVRGPGEWEAGHIEGAVHHPLNHLAETAAALPKDRDLVLICRSGYRSSTAAALLERAGFTMLADLRGGMLAWTEGAGASCSVQ